MSLRPIEADEGGTASASWRAADRTRLRVELATSDVEEILAFAATTGCRIERLLDPDQVVVSHVDAGDNVRNHDLVCNVERTPR